MIAAQEDAGGALSDDPSAAGGVGASVRVRLDGVRRVVAAAAERSGRDPGAIRIVAVTKTFPAAVVRAALDTGLGDVGENYVQEARAKREAAGGMGTWHLIGGLQRNKARAAAETFEWVHTIDSAALAAALSRHAAAVGRCLDVLLQVNVAADPAKRGIAPDGVAALSAEVAGLSGVTLRGLMTIGPADASDAETRRHFRRLRELRDATERRLGVELPHLSMGMSDDFAIAVEEGATLLRLGRALFGPREPRSWREGS